MKLVSYNSSEDITIQFEDGILRKGIPYKVFKSGYVSKNSRLSLGESRIGEVNYNTKGYRMRIVEYNNSRDAIVEFDDGTRRSGIEYSSFKKGILMNR